jgi:hypothetical protein
MDAVLSPVNPGDEWPLSSIWRDNSAGATNFRFPPFHGTNAVRSE